MILQNWNWWPESAGIGPSVSKGTVISDRIGKADRKTEGQNR